MRPIFRFSRVLVALVLATTFATGCADSATSPLAPNSAALSSAATANAARQSSSKKSKSSTSTSTTSTSSQEEKEVDILRFKTGINTSASASKVIGPAGGMLFLPETGFTLIVPMGAVSVPTTFTVTPVGGKYVAYDFEPHGATFVKPLTFVQDLSKTNYVTGAKIGGAYFSNKSQIDEEDGEAEVNELFTLSFDGFGLSFFSITHFSGYLVSMA